MSERLTYYYVPGFLHGTDCCVGLRLQKELKPHGVDLDLIDPKGGYTLSDCSISLGVAFLEALYEKHRKPLRILGASMGGFIALIYSAKYPQNIEKLILLNSALNLESVWYNILPFYHPNVPAEETMKKWKEEGNLMFQGVQMEAPEPISYNYVADSLTHPAYPLIDIQVLSLVASRDTVIPLSMHQEWKSKQKHPENVKLVEFDDVHGIRLDSSFEFIASSIADYSK